MKTLHIHPNDVPVFTDTLRFLEHRMPEHNVALIIFNEDLTESVVLGPAQITPDQIHKAALHARNGVRRDPPIQLDDKGFVQPEH